PPGRRLRSTLRDLVAAPRRANRGADAVADRVELTRRQGLARRQADDRRRACRELVVALELATAPRAERPVETDEARAVGTDAIQPGPTGRTDDPGGIDAP